MVLRARLRGGAWGGGFGGGGGARLARGVAGARRGRWILRDRRVDVVRRAVAHEGAWVQFLLRLSPVVPYVLLNYALGVYGVRLRDFWLACFGMMPTIIMYAYYGKVVGDVAKIAAGIVPPRGPEYYGMLILGLIATFAA